MKNYLLVVFLFAAVVGVIFVISGGQIATVRTLQEDQLAKEGFNPDRYVDGIWSSELLPTFREEAIEINVLLSELEADREQAIAQYGRSSAIGEVSATYSFMVQGTGEIVDVQHEALGNDVLYGAMTVDLAPTDGEGDVDIMIGERFSRRNTAVRDGVGFINFNDFTNQTEFASVSTALKDRILEEVITPLELSELEGQTIEFFGAFTLGSSLSSIEILPVIIEVQQ
jgi:predicted lipoprotein